MANKYGYAVYCVDFSHVPFSQIKEENEKFEKEIASAGIETDTVSPKLLPDYTRRK